MMIASISWWLLHLKCKWQPNLELKRDMQVMEEQRETEIEKNNLKHSKDTIRRLLVESLVNVQHTHL